MVLTWLLPEDGREGKTEAELIKELRELLSNCVRRHMGMKGTMAPMMLKNLITRLKGQDPTCPFEVGVTTVKDIVEHVLGYDVVA
jgi:hypothetical protein